MQKFDVVKGVAAPMPIANINTDAITPSAAGRSAATDIGKMMFANQRYFPNGEENPDFVLNKPPFRESVFLVAGPNFGCGSSRERAVWALQKFGIRAVIAPSFGDIFTENSYQNGLVPVVLPEEDCNRLVAQISDPRRNDKEMTVDLERQVVVAPDGTEMPFKVPGERRMAMLEGLEEVDLILRMEPDIGGFQAKDRALRPWAYL